MSERQTWIYLAIWILKDRVGMVVGYDIEEVRGWTSAAPEDHERQTHGFWRTDTRRTDAELQQWARESWNEIRTLGTPMNPEITISRVN